MQSPFFRQWNYPRSFQRQMNFNQQNKNQNTNKNNIPSNIKFEPFDKSMLEQIKSSIQDKPDINKISELIQSEHNGAIFYSQLLSDLQTETDNKILKKLKENSEKRENVLQEIYKSYNQDIFEVRQAEINKISDFKAGINFAIHEENDVAQSLLSVSNEINSPEILKKINCLFYQKLLDINYLMWIGQRI